MRRIELACVGAFLLYLLWLPLPFASITESARPFLILPPLILCALAAAIRATSSTTFFAESRSFLIWAGGGLLFAFVVGLQLVPVPRAILQALSPEASSIWTRAERVAVAAGTAGLDGARPLSVSPPETANELFRVLALLATFVAAAFLLVTRQRRVAFALALTAGGLFQVFYGVREAASGRYEIWGWKNHLIFNRVTGTFVNPNHFAHYLAITLPFVAYLGALIWHSCRRRTAREQFAALLRERFVAFSLVALVIVSFIAGMLFSKSRGALLAMAVGVGVAAVLASAGASSGKTRRDRAVKAVRTAAIVFVSFALLAGSIAVYISQSGTFERFQEEATRAGLPREAEITAGIDVWRRFPLTGSGAGTFEAVVGVAQVTNLESVFQHAHNDYVEILATTGVAGFSIALGALVGGLVRAVRRVIDARQNQSWRWRAFTIAALASLAAACTHALYDFNFFIPANAATLAAIAGAAASLRQSERSEARNGSGELAVDLPGA